MAYPPPTEKQARILWTSVTALAVGVLLALIALLTLGVGWVVNSLSSVLIPLAIAGVIAYLLDPIVDWFQKKRGLKRQNAIILVFCIAVLLVGGVVASVVPSLISQVGKLSTEFPKQAKKFQESVSSIVNPGDPAKPINTSTNAPAKPVWFETPREWMKNVGVTNEKAREFMVDAMEKTSAWVLEQLKKVMSLFGFLAGLALVPVYVFYFLLEKRGIKRNWTDYLPVRESRIKEEIVFVLHSINDCLIVFFRGQVLVAMCVGALLTIGFLVIGLDYAILLGVMAGLLSIIPYLGVALSIIPAFVLSMIQFVPDDGWLKPVLILVVFAAVQTMEGLFISPKIIGDRVGLHPLTIIVAVMVGTTLLGGIMGGVLAIPLTAALRTLMLRYVWKDRVHSSETSAVS
ncbi:MAG TPA: AI-2E family transporter [Verrucomicrobiota bacterium]|nr:AI-2E family transporter [Verrucomicrobiota bacterium]